MELTDLAATMIEIRNLEKMMSAFFLVDWESPSLSYLAKMKADFIFRKVGITFFNKG